MSTPSNPELAPVEDRPDAQVLKPALTKPLLLMFVIGDVLGAGIYALIGDVAGKTGGAVWTGFLAAGLLAGFTAVSYAELVTKFPRAAGAAHYTQRAFGSPLFTFVVAFAVMSSGLASAATLATAFGGDYLSAFVDLPTVLVGLVFIAVVALVNARGISESVKLNLGLTAIELGGLLLVTIIGVAFFLDGGGEASRAFEFKSGDAVPFAILSGAALAFYALIGFEDSVNVAEETKDPAKSYPFALFVGLGVALLIYLVVAFVATIAVPTDRLSSSSGALLEVTGQGPLAVNDKVFSAIALFALANGALINMIMASRLLYGMSNQGILPKAFGTVHEGRQTPWVAIIFTTLLAAVLIATGDLSDLSSMTVFLLLGVFIVVNVSVLVLRKDEVGHDHFRAPAAIPVLAALVCLWLMVFKTDGDIVLRSLFILGAGAILFLITWVGGGMRPEEMNTEKLEAVASGSAKP